MVEKHTEKKSLKFGLFSIQYIHWKEGASKYWTAFMRVALDCNMQHCHCFFLPFKRKKWDVHSTILQGPLYLSGFKSTLSFIRDWSTDEDVQLRLEDNPSRLNVSKSRGDDRYCHCLLGVLFTAEQSCCGPARSPGTSVSLHYVSASNYLMLKTS